MSWNYSQKTMQLFTDAVHGKPGSHLGEIKNPDGIGEHGSITCGDALRFTFRVKKDLNDPSKDIITEARYKGGNGNYVKIRHNGTYSTQYLHMSRIASGIRPGTKVTQGQTIGYVGSTGLANGPHLCYRFWKNGVQVDALKVEIPPSEPILEENKAAYDPVMLDMLEQLQNIPYSDQAFPILAGD